MQNLFAIVWVLFFAMIIALSVAFFIRGLKFPSKNAKIFSAIGATVIFAASAYLLPLLFAILSGASLGFMIGKPISTSIAYLAATTVSFLLCALVCFALHASTQFFVRKLAT